MIKNNKSTAMVIGILALYAYLIFINLNWMPFWEDEAYTAFAARNIVDFGAAYAFDGRNLLSAHWYGQSSFLNDDLTFRYPKIHFYTLATIFYIFGEGEIQARALSALFSLAAMIIFYDCLRLDFRNRQGFATLALCLTCFSSIVLLYSRSATYNAEALFFVILLYRLYLSYCIRTSIITACTMLVVAIAGFHTHYLINLSFVTALAIVHLCFHMRGIERRTVILLLLAIPYALQALWYGYLDPNTFELLGNDIPVTEPWYKVTFLNLANYFEALNKNGILFWSVTLYFLIWRCYELLKNRQITSNNSNTNLSSSNTQYVGWREDKVLQYLLLVLIMTTCIALSIVEKNSSYVATRYLSAIAPFATIITADVIWHVWFKHKIIGLILGSTILLSNVAGYPFLNHVVSGNNPRWTLPALAIEFHREYPSSLRKALNYLQANTKQDELVCPAIRPSPELIYYMTDKIYVCGLLSLKDRIPKDLPTEGREYLFKEDVAEGAIEPTWLVYFGRAPKLEIILYANGIYLLKKDFAVYRKGTGTERPEPTMHESFPTNEGNDEDKIAIYHRTDIKDLANLKNIKILD